MNSMRKLLSAAVLVGWGTLTSACANEQLAKLSEKLEQGILRENGSAKVAVLNFPYFDSRITKGSSIIQERITTALAERGKIAVIERTLLDKVLAENDLNRKEGMTAEVLKRMGVQLGVDVVITGTLNDVKNDVTEVNARAISTQTGRILAAGHATVKKTWDNTPVTGCTIIPRPDPRPIPICRRPSMQIALLLDTSNSMDGLINQAKTQLWRMVNELSLCRRGGVNPIIYVALYEYGNDRLDPSQGYIRCVLPFTADLDEVSQQLFALSTCGGSEYCGQVIARAVRDLSWERDDSTYKAIFIAGNEPFTQGPVFYGDAVRMARRNGIIVNTIFCGDFREGIYTYWKDGADKGGGEYMHIDQNADIVCTTTPYDDEIVRLGQDMNRTYIGYGAAGMAKKEAQADADRSAIQNAASGASMERMQFKASPQYSESASWDAVNIFRQKGVGALRSSELPAELKNKNEKELSKFITAKDKERTELQGKIKNLEAKRRDYLAQASTKKAVNSLDAAMLPIVRKQAQQKHFDFSGK